MVCVNSVVLFNCKFSVEYRKGKKYLLEMSCELWKDVRLAPGATEWDENKRGVLCFMFDYSGRQ